MTQGLLVAESATQQSLNVGARWREFSWLPFDLTLELPVSKFTVKDLLGLRPGSVVRTVYSRGAEIPLLANGQLIGWAEFEPVGDHIGVRITELK